MTATTIPTSLCNDCLRVRAFACWGAEGVCRCECGAGLFSYCSCDGCVSTAQMLAAGERDPRTLRLNPGFEIISWSAQGGLMERAQ